MANGHSDSTTILDTESLKPTEVKIPGYPEGVTRSQPIAVAFAAGGKTLYAACAGTNAIAVLQRSDKKWVVAGSIPTGWFPSSVAVLKDGSLRVVNVKGTGNTANDKGSFNSKIPEVQTTSCRNSARRAFHVGASVPLSGRTRQAILRRHLLCVT